MSMIRCPDFEDDVRDLVAGDVAAPRAEALRAHAAACADCARTLRRERRLAAELATWGADGAGLRVPPPPAMPDAAGRVLLLRTAVVAAAAAAAIVAAVVLLQTRAVPGDGLRGDGAAPAVEFASMQAERWLAVTGGDEFVASRRIAEGR